MVVVWLFCCSAVWGCLGIVRRLCLASGVKRTSARNERRLLSESVGGGEKALLRGCF